MVDKTKCWISLNLPKCLNYLEEEDIYYLALISIERKSFLNVCKEKYIQNLDKQKNFEEDKKNINNFFNSLEKINFT